MHDLYAIVCVSPLFDWPPYDTQGNANLASAPPRVSAASISDRLDTIQERTLKLLFGPSMVLPACPFKAPSFWGEGWRFYAKMALFAVPGAVLVVAQLGAFAAVVFVVSNGYHWACDTWQHRFQSVASDAAGTKQQEEVESKRFDKSRREREKKENEERLRRLRLQTHASFGVGAVWLCAMSASEAYKLRANYKSLTACKFAVRAGRVSVYGGVGLLLGTSVLASLLGKPIF